MWSDSQQESKWNVDSEFAHLFKVCKSEALTFLKGLHPFSGFQGWREGRFLKEERSTSLVEKSQCAPSYMRTLRRGNRPCIQKKKNKKTKKTKTTFYSPPFPLHILSPFSSQSVISCLWYSGHQSPSHQDRGRGGKPKLHVDHYTPSSRWVSASLEYLKFCTPETKPQPFPQTKSPFRFLGFCQL